MHGLLHQLKERAHWSRTVPGGEASVVVVVKGMGRTPYCWVGRASCLFPPPLHTGNSHVRSTVSVTAQDPTTTVARTLASFPPLRGPARTRESAGVPNAGSPRARESLSLVWAGWHLMSAHALGSAPPPSPVDASSIHAWGPSAIRPRGRRSGAVHNALPGGCLRSPPSRSIVLRCADRGLSRGAWGDHSAV
jgi:hypothetical protein